ncbi:MAG: FAD-dependent oxidoreductase [Minisyncoccia bacterium]
MNLSQKGTIASIKQITKGTMEVAIKVSENFNFIAGQYIWLQVPLLKYPDTKGNTRMYSISSSPNKKGELDIIFRLNENGYNRTLVEMIPGEEIIFSGPYGPQKLPEDKSVPVVFVAGGVGVASFLSMIRFSTETDSGHKIVLIYTCESEKEMVYYDELKQLEKDNSNLKIFSVVGLLKENKLNSLVSDYIDKETFWSVIGPKSFVDFVGFYLNKKGVSLRDINFEQFYPSLPITK